MPKQLILMACVVILGSLFAQLARADTNITNCTDLDIGNETYLLTQNITDSEAEIYCIDIEDNNITLDCQGYTIDALAPTASNSGINILSVSNATIKNCIISNWKNGIIDGNEEFINNSIKVINSTIFNNTEGITGNNFTAYINNSTFYDAGYDHIYVYNANNWTITNSNFYGTGDVYFDVEVNYGNFYNNLFNTTVYPVADSVNNWNTTRQSGTRIYSSGTQIGGNYWTNSTGNGYSDTCTDLLQDGFCDDPYDVNASVACAAVADGLPACGNNTDWLPLSTFYVEPPCQPSWNCTDWSECVRGYQTRDCVDDNQCENETGHPAEIQECFNGLPNATFNISDSCCPISQYYCTDNETLVQLWNTSEGVSWAVAECNYGCDNATSSCAPAPYEANLWTLAVIIGIIIAIAVLYRWSRR